jgi:uncharacterized protein (DUF2267 family)
MPMPWTYRHASKEFRAFLDDAKLKLSLESDNMAFTAVDGVFQVFRRRLTVQQGLQFADLLPCTLRALFVYRWDTSLDPLPFPSRSDLANEVQQVRVHHNLTPDDAITAVAWALRRCVNQNDLDRVLSGFPNGAIDYWHVDVDDPKELEQRIV